MERQWAKDPSPLKVREFLVADRGYVVCLDEEQRRKDVADRQAIVAALRDRPAKGGEKSLVGNKGYRKYVKNSGAKAFAMGEQKIDAGALYDGLWMLRTNMDLETELVARSHRHLWTVEELFRSMKYVLAARSICHKRDETVVGHIFSLSGAEIPAGPGNPPGSAWKRMGIVRNHPGTRRPHGRDRVFPIQTLFPAERSYWPSPTRA
ncbi:MAG TPA: hypothetical protein VMF06_22090 [Candidatus Limnocylindria bacterium]|nr:hypothetical protein [Candidatus Limnocylindria bacterium]